jgi:glutamate/tyrosine decarboxylase-like PLP-dependent enzyme
MDELEKVADQILNLVASKMPEKKEVQTHGELNREGWSRYDYAAGYNQAITDVKSILKGEESQ